MGFLAASRCSQKNWGDRAFERSEFGAASPHLSACACCEASLGRVLSGKYSVALRAG